MDDDERLAEAILALCDAMEKPTASEKAPLIEEARRHATYVRRDRSAGKPAEPVEAT